MGHFRKVLVLVLLAAFLWQTLNALVKYFRFGVTVTLEESPAAGLVFPSVSFCPILKNRSFGHDDPFKPTPITHFIHGFSHGRRVPFTLMEDVNITGAAEPEDKTRLTEPSWQKVVRIGQNIRNVGKIMECLTYTPGGTFDGGAFDVFVDSSEYLYLYVYIHEASQDILVPTPLYGTEFLQVPDRRAPESDPPNYIRFTYRYMISTEVRRKRSTENLPCYETEEYKEFSDHFMKLYDAGPDYLYHEAKCVFNCTYRTFTVESMNEVYPPKSLVVTADDGDLSSFDTCLRLYLSPAAVAAFSEVLSYDFYDAVGDVGGFLGLFLGASILSLYDEIRRCFARAKDKMIKNTV